MNIMISGQQITLGSSLQEYVKDRINQVVLKYFDHAISANIYFKKQNFQIEAEIIVNEGTGRHIVLKSNALSDEIYSSFDLALAKLEKQLRKYKSKISHKSERMKTSEAIESLTAVKYIIAPSTEVEEGKNDDSDNPVIIAEKPLEIHSLSVSEAVMKMDLENLPALVFINPKTNRVNMVYYRKDGNISWVDTQK